MKHHLIRLDRVAGEMNAWLLLIANGLGMLDLAVLVAKCIPAVTMSSAAAGHELAGLPPSLAGNSRG